MADNSILPKAQSALVDGAGRPTRAFYDFFRKLANGVQGQIDALAGIVATLSKVVASLGGGSGGEIIDVTAAIDAKADKATNVYGAGSLTGGGNLYSDQYLSLRGDVEAPPAISFYGVLDAAEGRGWQPLSANFATLDDGAGNLSLDLATVPDAGGGALLRFARDAWGRITGTSAATTTDLAEGDNLYFTDARVRATTLTGLSVATSTAVTAADSVLVGVGKLQAQVTDNLIPPGYIDGLQMQWVSGTALTVTSGAAYIQGSGKVLRAASAIAKAGLSLTASTWYHVYLYSNAGTADVEIVTTAPAAAYNGTARSKTGDTSRRYVGSVKTDASGAVLNFLHSPSAGYVGWRNNQGNPPFRVLANGVATSETTVAVGGATPVTARFAFIRLINTATGGVNPQLYTGVSDDSAAGPPIEGIVTVDMGKDAYVTHPMDSAQAMTYWYRTAPTGGAYTDVYGYTYER